jgi:hypothetical protein
LRRSLPEPAFVEGASVTITFREGPRALLLAVRPRDVDAGPVLVWDFADGERGNAAHDEALLATARGDPEVTIESGLVVQLRHAPKVMHDQFAKMRPEDVVGRLAFVPGPGIPVAITAHSASGATSTREVTVYPFPPAPRHAIGEHDRAFVGLDGAFMPYFGFRFLDDVGDRGQIAFLPQLNLGGLHARTRPRCSSGERWWTQSESS